VKLSKAKYASRGDCPQIAKAFGEEGETGKRAKARVEEVPAMSKGEVIVIGE